MPAILITDDHTVVRMGVRILITELYPDALIEEADTFNQAIEKLAVNKYDLILLDIHIPGGGNVQMIEAIRRRQPEILIAIFTSYEEEIYALPYIDAGADGYISKKVSPEEIKRAINSILKNEKHLSAKVLTQLLQQRNRGKEKGKKESPLSNRELEVMNLLIKGATNSEIKYMLNIHDSTVSTYKNSIFRKMGVSNVVDLINKQKQDKTD